MGNINIVINLIQARKKNEKRDRQHKLPRETVKINPNILLNSITTK